METESALYQLMGIRINGVINGITSSDEQYQEIVSRPPSKDIGRACRLNKQIQVKTINLFSFNGITSNEHNMSPFPNLPFLILLSLPAFSVPLQQNLH